MRLLHIGQQAKITLECLTAGHEGQPACYAIVCFDLQNMHVTYVAVMPQQLEASGASIHSLPSELLGRVLAGVDVYDR